MATPSEGLPEKDETMKPVDMSLLDFYRRSLLRILYFQFSK